MSYLSVENENHIIDLKSLCAGSWDEAVSGLVRSEYVLWEAQVTVMFSHVTLHPENCSQNTASICGLLLPQRGKLAGYLPRVTKPSEFCQCSLGPVAYLSMGPGRN